VCAGVVKYLRDMHLRRLTLYRLVRFRACTGPIIPFEALTMVGLSVAVLPDDNAVGLQPDGLGECGMKMHFTTLSIRLRH
jgi:hypothetical protein